MIHPCEILQYFFRTSAKQSLCNFAKLCETIFAQRSDTHSQVPLEKITILIYEQYPIQHLLLIYPNVLNAEATNQKLD